MTRRRVALVGVGLALCLAAPAQATSPGANGRIAFSSDRSGDFEVYSMNPDGSDLKRLTNAPGNDGPARWSPDGTKIVFASNRDGNSEIYTMNADGSNQKRLTNDSAQDAQPSWSPDGSMIAFSSLPAGGTDAEIYLMNADGSGRRQITATTAAPGGSPQGFNIHPYWGPDGRIAFASFDLASSNQGYQIFLMNADGSGKTQVTNDPSSAVNPIVGPGGTRIVFYSFRDGQGELYAINADGTGEARLTNAVGEDTPGSYSPDGTKVTFTSQRDGHSQVYVMNADGSDQVPLVSTPSNDVAPDWQSAPLPPPVIGQTVNVTVVSGTVLVKTRGSSKFSTLAQARQIKVGAQLDTTGGVVRLATAAGKGKTQSGDFGRGVFEVAQSKAAKGLTDLKLKGGSFGSCGASKASASAKKKKAIRSLFSKAKGKFRTKGRYSAASVRGTTWIVTDRCDGTLTQVKSGTVSVFDFKRHRTVKVNAGKSYLARAKR